MLTLTKPFKYPVCEKRVKLKNNEVKKVRVKRTQIEKETDLNFEGGFKLTYSFMKVLVLVFSE